MNAHVLVNHQSHARTKVRLGYEAELYESSNAVMVFPGEFRDVQSHYPIYLQKNQSTGEFHCVALMGFEPAENLFIENAQWQAGYIPLMIRKQPFYIGLKQTDQDTEGEAVITVDPSDPRLNENEGEALFLQDGSPSEYLQEISKILEEIHLAHDHAERFVKQLLELDLLEPFVLELTLTDDSVKQLLGFYTVKEEAIQQLSGQILEQLAKQGFLMPLFMMLASHSRVKDLIDRKIAAA